MLRKGKLLREKSLILPEVQNPFVHRIHLTWQDKIQIAVMTVTVLPIRLLLLILCLLSGWVLATVALAFRSDEEKLKPLAGWRNQMRPLVVFLCRGVFFFGGWHSVKMTGTRAPAKEAPILGLAPHSAYFDALPVVLMDLGTFVAKTESQLIPIFGTLIKFCQPVFVSREDPNSRQNTIKEIRKRAHSNGEWPQVIIFPEGTCTNRSCLITFKPGAFYPAVPVQPVCIRYTNKWDTYTWTWDGPTAFYLIWYSMCQFNNQMEMEFLPVYYPSEEEKNDAKLYASNVREVISQKLQVPVTDHTFDDCRLMMYAAKHDLPMAAGLIEFQKISRKLGMNFDNVRELLDQFIQIAKVKKGVISKEEFAEYLNLPVSPALEDMFAMYDRSNSGTIDFREYVIGLSLISQPASTESTIQLAFTLFDTDSKGYITQSELGQILRNAFGMEEMDSEPLFKQVDKDQDGRITYGEFKAFGRERPEYAKLFTTYQEMQAEAEEKILDNHNGPAAAVRDNHDELSLEKID